jgi:transposase-like protein
MAGNNILNDMKSILSEDKDFLKPLVSKILHEVLEEEMNKTIGAGPYERSAIRSGYYNRQFITRVGPIYYPPLRDSTFFRRKINYKPKKGEQNESKNCVRRSRQASIRE